MLKIKILGVGKTKEPWLENAIAIYLQRLKNQVQIEFVFVKDDLQLTAALAKEPAIVCLDSTGKLMTSEQFSSFTMKKLEEGGSRLTFVIGGAEGLPLEIKNIYPLISLSKLTFTHQMIRLMLIEQIYRAFEIIKGSPYHK